jgi:hypothetical protein
MLSAASGDVKTYTEYGRADMLPPHMSILPILMLRARSVASAVD